MLFRSKKERQDKGDEMLEQRLIREQIERASEQAQTKRADEERGSDTIAVNGMDEKKNFLQRGNGEKIILNLASKRLATDDMKDLPSSTADGEEKKSSLDSTSRQGPVPQISLAKNVMTTRKNVFGKTKSNISKQQHQQPKKISEVERIMKQELERKRTLAADTSLPYNNVRRKIH